MSDAAPNVSVVRLVTVIATVAIAFVAFRRLAPLVPLPHNVTKLVLWFAIPVAVLLVERRGNFSAALQAVGCRHFRWKSVLPGWLRSARRAER